MPPVIRPQEPAASFLSQNFGDVAGEFLEANTATFAVAPEKRLFFALLDLTMSELQWAKGKTSFRARRIRHDAVEWMESDDTTWVFSFINCCTAIEIDPATTRRKILEYVERETKGKGPGKRSWNLG